MSIDQDEITAQVYRIIKDNKHLPTSTLLQKILIKLPEIPKNKILISLNHLSEG